MIDTTRIKGIIFDYGGTIDSRGEHWSEVIYRGYVQSGVDVIKPDFRDAYVYAERELARTLHILPHHNFHDLLLIKIRIELEYLVRERKFAAVRVDETSIKIAKYCYESARECIEEARPTLEKLAEHYPLVLVSNFYGNVESVLADFHIDHFFRKIIESAVVKVRKPDPEIFRLGVRALALEPQETIVIGDSYRKDIIPARSIGCQTLWLKGKGWTDEEDRQEDPDIITRLESIVTLLEKA